VGCDSVVTLNLTINYTTESTDSIVACDSYTWIDGATYTESNSTATHILFNSYGCDSVITLNLTINNSTVVTDVITACDSYTWIDGITYTESNNTATHTLINSVGCDSVVTLDLTINIVDVSLTVSDPSIMANEEDASYQWLDCMDGYSVIPGETSQTFIAITNGEYAVEITKNGCTDTTDCITITIVGIFESVFSNQVVVYPNPNRGLINIDLGNLKNVKIEMINVNGQLIYHKEDINEANYQFELNIEPGIYFIDVFSDGISQRFKLVKM
jgi:hypothetical protein